LDRAGIRNYELLIAECGLKKKSPKSEIRKSKSEMEGPMLFPHNAFASGPRPFFFTEKKKSGGGKRRRTCPPPFLKKESFKTKISGKEGGPHGVQGGEIWIIILRRWFFHWIGPVLGGD